MERSAAASPPPTHTHPGNGRVQPATPLRAAQWPDVPARPYLCSASSSFRGLRPPPSPAALPRLLPRDRRPPTRKCPGVTPAAAAMETHPAPGPPPPAHGADPPPSWTHNEARGLAAPSRSHLPPPPSWARSEPSLAEAGADLAAGGVGTQRG